MEQDEARAESKMGVNNPEACYQDALMRLANCVTAFRGYQSNITKKEFEPAFEKVFSYCQPVLAQLNRGVQGTEAQRSERLRGAAERMLDDLQTSWNSAGKRKCAMQLEKDKIILALFFVPAVRKMELEISEEYAYTLQKLWVERYPQSPFQLVRFDTIANGFQKKIFGMCFITTAVCEAAGKPDDCAELTAFRAFRDDYLLALSKGPALVREYYEIAPGIVTCIDVCTDRAARYEAIREQYLAPCYADLQNGRLERCKERYIKMVRDLEKEYLT